MELKVSCNTTRRLLSQRVIGSMIALFVAVFSVAPVNAGYVHTNGTQIVDGNDQPIFFTGINLGNWLLWEGYLMMGDFNYRTHTQFFNSLKNVLGGIDQAIEFEHQWRLNYVTEKSIAELKGLGFNSVRVPFNYNMFWYQGQVSDHGFQYLDRLIEYCRLHGVYILLDMHAAPGYQNPGDHSDNVNSNSDQPRDSVRFWDDNNVEIAAQVWRHIADRYKNEPLIWGYDLINEPVPQDGREYELLPSLIRIRNAIREVDNNHTIVAEGSWWASDMSKIDWTNADTQARTGVTSQWDNNLVYQTHHYVFGNWDWLNDLYARDDITNRMGIPLILGEMGEDTPEILRTMSDWATQNIAGYFPWSFKKMSHDRTLWTIPTNDIYNQVKNSIQTGEWFIAGAYDGMVDFAKNNIANGATGLVWHQDFYDGIRPINVPTPPPPPTTNALGPLTLFEHCDYGGYSVKVPVGEHNLSSLQNLGLNNDDISSFQLAKGFALDMYQHDNFEGYVHHTLDSDDCLVNEGYNDDLTSLKIRADGNTNLAGQYFIKNRESGLYLDVQDFCMENGANLLQWHFGGGSNQQFELVHQGNGAYTIRSVLSGKVLDVDAISANNGANIFQWEDVGGSNQRFVVYPVDGYVQLIATHSGKVIEVVNGSSEAGANVQQFDNNNQTTSHWVLEPVNGGGNSNPSVDFTVQAETFTSSSAVSLDTATDPLGGGQYVGWVDAGDWMAYTGINIPNSGTYKVEYRVASPESGHMISLDLNAGAIQLGQVEVENTGDWQNWSTVSHSVYIEAGIYDLGIYAPTGGWNLNWVRIYSE